MTWVRLDDLMPDHPKIAPLSDRAFRLHISGLCYAARALTDGHVPRPVAQRLVPSARRAIDELVGSQIWEEDADGYEIHDFGEYQQTRESVLEQRAKTADRVARWREQKRGGNTDRNAVTPSVGNGVSNAAPQPNSSSGPSFKGQRNSKVVGQPLTIENEDTPAALAAQALLEALPNATEGTLRRIRTQLRRGAAEGDFHDARHALREKQPPPKNPAAWACGIVDDRMKARQA